MSKNAGMIGALGVRIDDLAVTAARLLDPDRRCVTRTIFPGGGDGTHHTDPSAMCAAAAKALAEVGSESPGMDVKDVVFDLGPALAHSLSADSRARVGRVTAIRISPSPVSIQLPFASWPPGIRNRVDGGFVHMVGGTDLHGGQPLPLDNSALDSALRQADEAGADSISVAAVGALMDPDTEYAAAEYLVRHAAGRKVVLSHEVGGLRFVERENSAILNAALLVPAEDLLDKLQSCVSRPAHSHHSFLRADGSRVGREEARASPTHLVGTEGAALAQGAAAFAGVDTAVILEWEPDRVRLLTLEEGFLRTGHLRHLRPLPGVQFSQRHAAQSSLPGVISGESMSGDLLQGQHALVVAAADFGHEKVWSTEQAQAFEAYGATIRSQHPQAHLVRESSAVLSALGAAVALPQSEVIRYAVVDGPEDLEAKKATVRHIAQGRVLSAQGAPITLRTVSEQATPVSFLLSGPVLLRVQVVGVVEERE